MKSPSRLPRQAIAAKRNCRKAAHETRGSHTVYQWLHHFRQRQCVPGIERAIYSQFHFQSFRTRAVFKKLQLKLMRHGYAW